MTQETQDGTATNRDGSAPQQSYEDQLLQEDRYRQAAIDQARTAGEPIPELYFATVRAIGTPLQNAVIHPLEQVLAEAGYEALRVSAGCDRGE